MLANAEAGLELGLALEVPLAPHFEHLAQDPQLLGVYRQFLQAQLGLYSAFLCNSGLLFLGKVEEDVWNGEIPLHCFLLALEAHFDAQLWIVVGLKQIDISN